jgi:hypothetical protein
MAQMREGFKREDFQEARNANTIEGARSALEIVAQNLNDIDPASLNPRELGRLDRVCFLVVNTYEKKEYRLGPGPLNDSLTVAEHLSDVRHRIGFLHNTKPAHFLKWLRFLLENVTDSLFLFYTGHGASIRDRSGDEADGYDEVIVFDSGYIVDDQLADYLKQYTKVKRVVLMSDCCHSGTIWDIPEDPEKLSEFPKNLLSISSSMDSQTAKQTKLESKDQGIFTFYFWDFFDEDPEITPREIEGLVNGRIRRYNQVFVAMTTSPSMLDEPLVLPPERRQRRPHGEGRGRRGGRGGGSQ